MERMAQIIKVKAEVIPEYKRIHAAVWPEILKAISASNIRNYTIFLKEPENILFAYWEYHGTDFKADMEKIKQAPRMRECGTSPTPCRSPTKPENRATGGLSWKTSSTRTEAHFFPESFFSSVAKAR